MSQYRRFTARTALLTAGTAGFVALGSGFAGADTLESVTEEIAPMAERALMENVAPTVNSLVPQGTGSAAGGALDELQQTANDPDKPAPDLGETLPKSEERIVTPVGDAPNPVPVATDTLAEGQEMTGLDGDPYDTAGHRAGEVVEETAHGAGDRFEESAHSAGGGLEETVTTVVPQAAHTVVGVRDQVLPQVSDLERVTALPSETTVGMAGDGNREEPPTVPQSSQESPGVVETATSAADGLTPEGVETFSLSGPAADTDVRLADGELDPALEAVEPVTGQVEESLPQSSELGLPQVAEGMDTGTAEDLVSGLSRGTDLVHDIDLSDPVSISGGTEAPETPEGMVEYPTVTDLPGSDALPVVS
ncbi:hypothetical protein [Nocardiopsis xinjiangensis]|uniref:hypothetical protein n=1 Tax=Nocardiopsis xinjiangensis TaxID=124285 RepID=UPI0003475138|nr:hypothetical protein [Nocardiopsis xinjiangensis]